MESIIKTLCNPTRIKLLHCIGEKPKTVTEMISVCHLSQSAVSQHLAKLRKADLVTTVKEGKEVFYTNKNSEIKNAVKQLIKFI